MTKDEYNASRGGSSMGFNKSLDQKVNEANARSIALNAKNLFGTQNYLSRKTASGGYESYRDPQQTFANPEYLKGYSEKHKPTQAGATLWDTSQPGSLLYSPTGSDWQMLNEGSLNDPTTYSAVERGANTPSAAQGAFKTLLGKASPTAKTAATAAQGSSFSLTPEVLSKMWR